MFLDYSKIEFDSFGRPDTPELQLQTLGRDVIGTLSGVYNLKFNIRFSETSEMSFSIPKKINGIDNPLYDQVTGHKIIYTKSYGIYIIMNPSTESDGMFDVKNVTGYSIEKTLELKKFFIEEGTFNFWNPASTENTILGRIFEIAPYWSVGYVSPTLIGKYRTFDSYDDYLLSFIYGTVPEKYRCVFVFDPYNMSVNVYDADEERPSLPISLDFDNLLQNVSVNEISDELVTALRPYGSDELDIRPVNPIGSNWIYDLSYFISNGDISEPLSSKWTLWQKSILNNQNLYNGLIGLQASTNSLLLSLESKLVDLLGELEDLTNQQSIAIQAIAMETTQSGKEAQQEVLDEINSNISKKKNEIKAQEEEIVDVESNLDEDDPNSYSGQIKSIVDSLSISKFFTAEEYNTLSQFFIEKDITEDTFVASSINENTSGLSSTFTNGHINISMSYITEIPMGEHINKNMFTISGGFVEIAGDISVSGDIIRGTIEYTKTEECVLSVYVGETTVESQTVASGMITITGKINDFTSDIKDVVEQEITTRIGTSVSFGISTASLYITTNISEYQRYSVQMELFDYAVSVLHDVAVPTFEFSIDSANFIFSQAFSPFRDKLELGKSIYLKMDDRSVITPIIIEVELDFESKDNFSLVFSNRFKRYDNVSTLKDMIESSYSSSRSFDSSKYTYNQVSNQATEVSKFMNSSLDAAVNSIIGAKNQSVIINGAGIQVGGESNYKLRIVNNMIAMTDDDWQTSKMAIGRFASPEIGEYWGINTEVLGGKIVISNNLLIESQADNNVVQFRVDSTGAWLNNSTFVLQKDSGGKIIIDPEYGIVAGNGNLFTTEGTTVTPSFIDDNGNIEKDEDGMPINANFYIDSRDGNAYFRGTVNAISGSIGGWTLSDDSLHSGSGSTFVSLNASKDENALYAIWAGSSSPENAPFSVKRDGSILATDGTFKGVLETARVSGVLSASGSDSWIEGCGIRVGANAASAVGYNFFVDTLGNVNILGNLNLKDGAISWGNLDTSVTTEINDAVNTAQDAYGEARDAYRIAEKIANGTYSGGTFINKNEIFSPIIHANEFVVIPDDNTNRNGGYSMYGYYDNDLYSMLSINYFGGDTPRVIFESDAGAYAEWSFGFTTFKGSINFSNATVSGLTATFG